LWARLAKTTNTKASALRDLLLSMLIFDPQGGGRYTLITPLQIALCHV
jgi:hypothetical protein